VVPGLEGKRLHGSALHLLRGRASLVRCSRREHTSVLLQEVVVTVSMDSGHDGRERYGEDDCDGSSFHHDGGSGIEFVRWQEVDDGESGIYIFSTLVVAFDLNCGIQN